MWDERARGWISHAVGNQGNKERVTDWFFAESKVEG